MLMITKFPAGYPAGYDLPAGANTCEHQKRGWCFAESATAMLSSHLVLDISDIDPDDTLRWTDRNHGLVFRCVAGRRAPLLPAQFASELEKKTFTNGKEDFPLVRRLYNDAFAAELSTARYLNFGGSVGGAKMWGDTEATQLAAVLQSGACPLLEEINLSANVIGHGGSEAIANSIRSGKAPSLRIIQGAAGDFGETYERTESFAGYYWMIDAALAELAIVRRGGR